MQCRILVDSSVFMGGGFFLLDISHYPRHQVRGRFRIRQGKVV